MESAEATMMVIAFINAWFIIDLNDNNKVLEGPFENHADAVQRVEIRAYRISRGWQP